MAPGAVMMEAMPPATDISVKLAPKTSDDTNMTIREKATLRPAVVEIETDELATDSVLDIKMTAADEEPKSDAGVVEDLPADPVDLALFHARQRFAIRNTRSMKHHSEALRSMPGGNTRTMLHTSPFPVYLKSGKDYQVTSEDGHTYTDLVGELTAAVYGHSHPVIQDTIVKTLTEVGMCLGGQTEMEYKHAAAMCERFHLDSVRFTNCGTEANIHALAAARAFTKRRKVIVFGGGYHGGVLTFSGGKRAENVIDKDDFIVLPYNDMKTLNQVAEAILEDGFPPPPHLSIAAILVEGMQGSAGAIVGHQDFLRTVQEVAGRCGAIFILDEVMTSRLASGGLASIYGLKPGLRTFGKYLGGGLAFGAFGGRADVMSVFDPTKPDHLTHHGTFNNNTLAMHAGYAGLTKVYTPEVCKKFNAQGQRLLDSLNLVTEGTKMVFTGMGAVFASHFPSDGEALTRETEEDGRLKELFWLEMMENGFWITKRGSIALILGTAQSELVRFLQCVSEFLERHWEIVRLSSKLKKADWQATVKRGFLELARGN